MSTKDFLDFDESPGGEMYTKLNERSELERFRNNHSQEELDEMESEYRGLWEHFFEENHEQDFPLHPWKILKHARADYAENMNNGDWPCMEKRHALRVVKDEYAVKWREIAYD